MNNEYEVKPIRPYYDCDEHSVPDYIFEDCNSGFTISAILTDQLVSPRTLSCNKCWQIHEKNN
jgi:hypothetical protein